jgi:hypothetical protein
MMFALIVLDLYDSQGAVSRPRLVILGEKYIYWGKLYMRRRDGDGDGRWRRAEGDERSADTSTEAMVLGQRRSVWARKAALPLAVLCARATLPSGWDVLGSSW